jgi:hypothetical protein
MCVGMRPIADARSSQRYLLMTSTAPLVASPTVATPTTTWATGGGIRVQVRINRHMITTPAHDGTYVPFAPMNGVQPTLAERKSRMQVKRHGNTPSPTARALRDDRTIGSASASSRPFRAQSQAGNSSVMHGPNQDQSSKPSARYTSRTCNAAYYFRVVTATFEIRSYPLGHTNLVLLGLMAILNARRTVS